MTACAQVSSFPTATIIMYWMSHMILFSQVYVRQEQVHFCYLVFNGYKQWFSNQCLRNIFLIYRTQSLTPPTASFCQTIKKWGERAIWLEGDFGCVRQEALGVYIYRMWQKTCTHFEKGKKISCKKYYLTLTYTQITSFETCVTFLTRLVLSIAILISFSPLLKMCIRFCPLYLYSFTDSHSRTVYLWLESVNILLFFFSFLFLSCLVLSRLVLSKRHDIDKSQMGDITISFARFRMILSI